jgi:N-acetylmuramoyl-L-alanine amidase
MNKLRILLDAGHGGIFDGKPVTPGKRSPIWPDGTQLIEGVSNRDIRDELAKLLRRNRIPFTYINKGQKDMSLQQRCDIANALHKKYKNTLLISIHSDAASNPQASGWSCYTSPGQTPSDEYATVLYEEAKLFWGEYDKETGKGVKFRESIGDGDPDKEAKFKMLTGTIGPAILSENFFMTNEKDCRYLMTRKAVKEIAQVHLNMIKRFVA